MNYDLALKLKEAGFKQTGMGQFVYPVTISGSPMTEGVYSPTLNELIEACGDKFFALRQDKKADTNEVFYWAETDHATTAVANLWLTLNKKNNMEKEPVCPIDPAEAALCDSCQ